MGTFIIEHLFEILFGLISAGALAFCKHMIKENKKYKQLLEEKKYEDLEEIVESKISSLRAEINQLRQYVVSAEKANEAHLDLILTSYRYRLISLCRIYLRQGYMKQEQYEQLTEFYKVYHGLGGNDQGTEIYNKTIKLPIHD